MKCVQCGKEFNGNFCPVCGYAVDQAQVVSQQPYIQQPNIQQIPSYQMPLSPQQPPKKKMAWWKIAIGAVVLFILLAACFGDDQESEESNYDSGNNAVTDNNEYDEYDEYGNEDKGYGFLGDYKLKIQSAEIAYYSDKYLIVVTYEFQNNGDSLASFNLSITDSAFQDGIKLENDSYYLSVIQEDKYFKNAGKDIQKGKSITVKQAYVLENTTDIVTIQLKRMWSFSDDSITKRFSLE